MYYENNVFLRINDLLIIERLRVACRDECIEKVECGNDINVNTLITFL